MLTCLIKTQHNQMKSKVLWTNIQWNFKSKKITTIYGSHIDHIRTNAPSQQYMFGVVEAYWIDHNKPIYFAFKFLDYVPQYHHIGKK
jgi:hypothetical protein